MGKRVIWDGLCCVEIPQDWSVSEEQGVITICGENGVGALQLSFASRERKGSVEASEPLELMSSWTHSRGFMDVGLKQVRLGGGHAAECQYIEESEDGPTFWHVWSIVGENRAALITYVSEAADSGIEKVEREQIVASFSWL